MNANRVNSEKILPDRHKPLLGARLSVQMIDDGIDAVTLWLREVGLVYRATWKSRQSIEHHDGRWKHGGGQSCLQKAPQFFQRDNRSTSPHDVSDQVGFVCGGARLWNVDKRGVVQQDGTIRDVRMLL